MEQVNTTRSALVASRSYYQPTPAQRVELQVATYLFRLRLKLRREARDAGKVVRS